MWPQAFFVCPGTNSHLNKYIRKMHAGNLVHPDKDIRKMRAGDLAKT